MDVLKAIKGRRSIRRFTEEPLAEGVLERLLDAARWAPTASNQQRWRFVVVTSPTVKKLIRQFAPGIFVMPAAFVVICVEKEPDATPMAEVSYVVDCGIAAQNLMLAAYAMGIGSCPALSYAKAAISEILDLPEGIEPVLVITLGYPAEAPEPPARLALNRIAFSDGYGKEWTS